MRKSIPGKLDHLPEYDPQPTLVAIHKLTTHSSERLLILRPGTTRVQAVPNEPRFLRGLGPVRHVAALALTVERNRREFEEPWTMGREGWAS